MVILEPGDAMNSFFGLVGRVGWKYQLHWNNVLTFKENNLVSCVGKAHKPGLKSLCKRGPGRCDTFHLINLSQTFTDC